jgi:predicted permease
MNLLIGTQFGSGLALSIYAFGSSAWIVPGGEARSWAARSIPRIRRPDLLWKFSSATGCGSGPSEATRTFWVEVYGSTTLVSRDRRHAGRLSRSGADSGGKEHRNVVGNGFCRRACPASATQFAVPSGSHRANQTWTDDCGGTEPVRRVGGILAERIPGGLLAPALHAGRLDLIPMLKQEGRGSTGSREQVRTRRVLVITEFALSLVLMIAAGLLLRSFGDLLNVRLGFNPQNVMAVRVWLPIPNDPETDIYRTPAQEAPLIRELLRRGRTLPGVEEAAVGDLAAVPLGHSRNDLNPYLMILEGHETQGNQAPLVDASIVTPEYFHLLGMTLLRGRLIGEFDNEKAPPVAVINEAFARTYWPNGDPLGRHLKLDNARGTPANPPWTTVVGVVADARTESLTEGNVPQMYLSLYQRRAKDLAIFVRGRRLDSAVIPVELREQVQSVNPELTVFGAQTLNEMVSASLSERRFSMEMVGLFALTALLLAGLGIYGVISYIVSERTHEIGIRLALGAQSRNILRMVLRQGLRLAIAGAAVGLVCALIVSHLMAGLLYGVRPTDPLTFAGVAILLIGVSLLACYIPARRAMRVDPNRSVE